MTPNPPGLDAPVIAIVGDRRPRFVPHDTIAPAIAHADQDLGVQTHTVWTGTDHLTGLPDAELARFDGFWIAPGSPYHSLDGALRVIQYARENDRPLLGTCGGFQHVVLEFARNVLGVSDAAHAEYDPYASQLFIRALSCSLAGQSFPLDPRPATRAGNLYDNHPRPTETYYCDFALTPEHVPALVAAGLTVSATDHTGEPRIIEITNHTFYLATLFVPQTRSAPSRAHPIIKGFISSLRLEPTAARTARRAATPRPGPAELDIRTGLG